MRHATIIAIKAITAARYFGQAFHSAQWPTNRASTCFTRQVNLGPSPRPSARHWRECKSWELLAEHTWQADSLAGSIDCFELDAESIDVNTAEISATHETIYEDSQSQSVDTGSDVPSCISNDERNDADDGDIIYSDDNHDSFPIDAIEINGTSDGLIVTRLYYTPLQGFHNDDDSPTIPSMSLLFSPQDCQRLNLSSTNITLPAALMLLDPITYPTQSRARKAIRKRSICFSRYNNTRRIITTPRHLLSNMQFRVGKVLTRIYPGDVIGFQRRIGNDYYAIQGVPYRAPPFDVPVIFQDDHMAIVNKPPGIVLYRAEGGRGGGTRGGGHGRDTLLSALPFVFSPSNIDDARMIQEGHVPLTRPHPVHRLDRPTSGLVVVAKTKSAAIHLARQFEIRKVKKTYMAIVNGYPVMPKHPDETGARSENKQDEWNTIDYELEGKSAVTDWRVIDSSKSLYGQGGVLTLVEMKPRTGRYHQLRRHFAWVCRTPLVGDSLYDNGDSHALRLRKRGLFLCSNEIEIEHPYYNTPLGRMEWLNKVATQNNDEHANDCLYEDEENGNVMVKARINLPEKFLSFFKHENERAETFLT
ncbi:hypothetical protein HJC23_002445 [Cyclotella cryptica]|uniref:Pseudouridine synthase RsuA/RluA-like domain-containing protein n=1 Tax=Cyclotella cryptica TaxID=29204 RepID=A0ABD3PUN7_9STRA|eukprot:CCRYP_011192-RB/>CCRYP_011192-RB protein AED:0.05 eAED:0.05 QI:98/1/1/1/0.5/0.33/3/460/587